ncbi:MAG TPA: DoxX family protein [Chthoniobacteraceae bacterium]|jgi:putative oxidoreductase|nr:DoxX family protein [Chthoniobacteraceae bacterium]
MNSPVLAKAQRAYEIFARAAEKLQSPLLLVMRLYWGWSFFVTGKGKLLNLDKTAEFFAELGLPLPKLNAVLAGSTECFGGLLLLVGLGSRLVSVPLAFTMLVAYFTADREALVGIFSEPDKFLAASPFLFLLTTLIVLAFGPGVFSLDWLIARKLRREGSES